MSFKNLALSWWHSLKPDFLRDLSRLMLSVLSAGYDIQDNSPTYEPCWDPAPRAWSVWKTTAEAGPQSDERELSGEFSHKVRTLHRRQGFLKNTKSFWTENHFCFSNLQQISSFFIGVVISFCSPVKQRCPLATVTQYTPVRPIKAGLPRLVPNHRPGGV